MQTSHQFFIAGQWAAQHGQKVWPDDSERFETPDNNEWNEDTDPVEDYEYEEDDTIGIFKEE